ncbi:MAG: hypothetical protein HY746_00995 [Elusimicrobia bacterium]|nr:hypothetical protein [Elusimicrobiota bacterium]
MFSNLKSLLPLSLYSLITLSSYYLIISFVLFSTGCSGYYYDDAVKFEKQGALLKAAKIYEMFVKKHPEDPRAGPALLKAADIYSKKFQLCRKAVPLYELILKDYGKLESVNAAKKGLYMCPDYFPLEKNRTWTYGDSQTFGRNIKEIHIVKEEKNLGASVKIEQYAGKKLAGRIRQDYSFTGDGISINTSDFKGLRFKYPVKKGIKWTSKIRGQKVMFEITGVSLKIEVDAGAFENCIRIEQRFKNAPSWVNEYYAPWVGRIMTATAGTDFENRIMELLSYE